MKTGNCKITIKITVINVVESTAFAASDDSCWNMAIALQGTYCFFGEGWGVAVVTFYAFSLKFHSDFVFFDENTLFFILPVTEKSIYLDLDLMPSLNHNREAI